MTRDQLVQAGVQAILEQPRQHMDYHTVPATRAAAAAVVAEVEPLIRADEREHRTAEVAATGRWCREDERATIRAQVTALRDEAMDHHWAEAIVAYQTVLALIDGGSG